MAGRSESIRSLCRRTAVCGLCAGLSVVLMAVGSAFGVLTYVCPMLAGIPVYLVRRAWGTRTALCLWAAAGLLGLMLVPDREMAALFLGLVGWYPAVKPVLDRLPSLVRRLAKGACFGVALLVLYAALLAFMGLDALGLGPAWENLLLWLMGVGTLALYDTALLRLAPGLERRLGRVLFHP